MGKIGENFDCGDFFTYTVASKTVESIHIQTRYTEIELGTVVNFCFPFADDSRLFTKGMVTLKEKNLYRIHPLYMNDARVPLTRRTHVVYDFSVNRYCTPEVIEADQLVQQSVQECIFVKQGAFVCLQHIFIYLSRFSILSLAHLHSLQKGLFSRLLQKVQEHIDELEQLYCNMTDKKITLKEEILHMLALAIVPEFSMKEMRYALQTHHFDEYFLAVKQFEERLNYHCNVIALVS